MEQLLGISDVNDPCQNPGAAAGVGPAMANVAGAGFQCYNASTGTYYNCSVSGTPTGLTPAGTGPNTVPVVTNSSWIVLAAVLGGLVLFAAVVR